MNFSVRYDAVFEKKGDMVFISHLDLMRLFSRAARRAKLPFVLTQGFTPRVKISMPKALKLGVASDNEQMSLWLSEELIAGSVTEAVNKELPDGIRILSLVKA